MKRIILFALLLTPFLTSRSSAQMPTGQAGFIQYLEERNRQVSELWQKGDIRQAVEVLEELLARKELRDFESPWQVTLYNLACGCSLLNEKEKALAYLRNAVDVGYSDLDQLHRDTDLDNIRGTQEFRELVARLKGRQRFWDNPAVNTPFQEDISEDEKLIGLSKLWSEVKYGFAFFDHVPELNWDSLYVAYLPKVRRTQSTLEYYRVLEELCSHLKDGHTGVNLPPDLYERSSYRPPISTRLIEDKVLVVGVDAGKANSRGVRPGLEVTRIDGIPTREYALRTIAPYLKASTPQGRDVQLYDYKLLLGPKDTEVMLELADAKGRTFNASLPRTLPTMVRPSAQLDFRMLGGRIAYVGVPTLGDDVIVSRFDSLFARISAADALIIDLRDNGGGNSSVGWNILGRLTDRPFAIERFLIREYLPTHRAWGRGERLREEPMIEWQPVGSKPFTKPVVVLTSARTGSAAEDFCVAFRQMGRGKIVGEPTAGSTGQPLVFALPGGGNATVCTAHCSYADGTEFVGVGVLPDIEVHPTVRDVRAHKDAVLDAAVHLLKKELGR